MARRLAGLGAVAADDLAEGDDGENHADDGEYEKNGVEDGEQAGETEHDRDDGGDVDGDVIAGADAGGGGHFVEMEEGIGIGGGVSVGGDEV